MAGDVDWDPRKSVANLRKHGIEFVDAVDVLYDERAITVEDERSSERRYVTIGLDAVGRVLVVVYAWRDDRPRIISARRATPSERRQYEEKS